MEKYIDFKNPINAGAGTVLRQLHVSVDYTKGGMNYFSGGVSPRGVYVYFKPVTKNTNGLQTSIMMGGQRESGFKILLEELPRKSQKAIDKWGSKIALVAERATELYESGQYHDIDTLVKELVFA